MYSYAHQVGDAYMMRFVCNSSTFISKSLLSSICHAEILHIEESKRTKAGRNKSIGHGNPQGSKTEEFYKMMDNKIIFNRRNRAWLASRQAV